MIKKTKKIGLMWSLKKPLYLEPKDKRYKAHLKQLKKFGFSDGEIWNLDYVIARFVLPRLQRFREISMAYPADLGLEKWHKILDEMIFAFKHIVDEDEDESCPNFSKKDFSRYKKGIKLFALYFKYLWY